VITSRIYRDGFRAIIILIALGVFGIACTSPEPAAKEEKILAAFPLDSFEGIVDVTALQIDPGVFAEGEGSARIESGGTATVRLFEIDDPDVEYARLVYRARLKTANVAGKAYLEMWCSFPGKGENFSRSLQAPLSGTADWTEVETPFFLKKGENPDRVRLNVVLEGGGTLWVDDIRLVAAEL